MVILGLLIIFRFEFGYWLGLTLSLMSAVLGACFMVINGNLAKKSSPFVITFYEMVGACIFCILFMPLYAYLFAANGLQLVPLPMDWLWLALLAGICTVYALSVSVELMKRLTAFSINLTVNLEPVYGIILAVLIFGDKENMSPGFYLGTLVILSSVCLYPLFNFIHKRRKTKQLLRLQ